MTNTISTLDEKPVLPGADQPLAEEPWAFSGLAALGSLGSETSFLPLGPRLM